MLQDEVALLSFENVNEFFAAIGDQRVDAVATVERMSKRTRDGIQPAPQSMAPVGVNI